MESKKRDIKEAKGRISRRSFLGGSAAAVASLTIVPHNVLGGTGNIPPSEKLNIAGIGGAGKSGPRQRQQREYCRPLRRGYEACRGYFSALCKGKKIL
ncbi:MAG: twin-arginine translocation signal domain-containing protein [Phycisphaerae bacterium]|nr:twin-arginine translocation signal domain-containing protein [Phycisphaerae bacterium]NIP53021.1 twin-arginine translocation signal domain-containing protein [Phycisphaerae bacterium]NIS53680.1 twin-arginine translocation signal domain-containing protein [Phycisphaerae bacterium]NIU11243.1 twin-arginine translocation signal domain-containing protein [Phycisphaerae bacterium]NIU57300.1 twin-arginine translocation signal domain-containing protein [Phycisphaerae bacterium]